MIVQKKAKVLLNNPVPNLVRFPNITHCFLCYNGDELLRRANVTKMMFCLLSSSRDEDVASTKRSKFSSAIALRGK
jgi:hypothetical protein